MFRHYVDGRRPGCCRSELDARDDGTIANAVAPVRFPRARRAPRSPRYRAHTARRPHKVSARPASAPPRTRGKKPRGEDGPGTLFTSPPRAPARNSHVVFLPNAARRHLRHVCSRLCGARLARARTGRAGRPFPRSTPVPVSDPSRGTFGKRLVGFFREIPGDGRAGCSTRARAHFDPGFFRMSPSWVLRATVRFLAYYTRHSRVRCGANDHPS